jgi:hypothetical protein
MAMEHTKGRPVRRGRVNYFFDNSYDTMYGSNMRYVSDPVGAAVYAIAWRQLSEVVDDMWEARRSEIVEGSIHQSYCWI